MRGVLEQLEWRLGRVERCLDVTMGQTGVQMPEEFYEETEEDCVCCRCDLCEEGPEDDCASRPADWAMGEGACDVDDRDGGLDIEADSTDSGPGSKKARQRRLCESQLESPCIQHNALGSPFSIKLVPPSFYHELDLVSKRFEVKFSKSKANLAASLDPGDLLFIYIMAPEKRIIGLAAVVEPATFYNEVDRWPWRLEAEWEIGPKMAGVTFSELGIKVRPRIGDTIYALQRDKAMEAIGDLRALPDLTWDELESYRSRYDSGV